MIKFLPFILLTCPLLSLYYGAPGIATGAQEGVFFKCSDLVGIKVGYLGDITLDKSLSTSSKRSLLSIESFFSQREQGTVTINFINRFEVYSSLGSMRLKAEPKINKNSQLTLATANQFTWGLGGRGVIFDYQKVSLGIDIKYQSFSPCMKYAHNNSAPQELYKKARLKYREWQIGLGASYDNPCFSPYIGALYNQTSARFSELFTQKTALFFHSRKKFGMAAGVMISSGKVFELDLEARMICENAVSACGNFRF